jgi:hypothetical protein
METLHLRVLLEPFLYAYVLLCFKFLAKLFLPLLVKSSSKAGKF